jgi:hypothetical protein
MLVLDALFDHFQQILSNVEIIGSLVQCRAIPSIGGKLGHPSKIVTAPPYAQWLGSGRRAGVAAQSIEPEIPGPRLSLDSGWVPIPQKFVSAEGLSSFFHSPARGGDFKMRAVLAVATAVLAAVGLCVWLNSALIFRALSHCTGRRMTRGDHAITSGDDRLV